MKDRLVTAIADLEEEEAIRLVKAMLDEGMDPNIILDASRDGMKIIGDRYEAKEYFLPELIVSGELLKEVGALIKPKLREQAGGGKPAGTVLLGTVAGDIHDLGKDVVSFMLDVNNFEVHDLGVDVPSQVFVKKVGELKPDILGMSGFLTLAYDQMKKVVTELKEAGLRNEVKIMIGGAVMDDQSAKYIGADAYGADASAAVKLAKAWMGGK
jgi:5-methyltetrahydrofolate--homocysteine methyltransferase